MPDFKNMSLDMLTKRGGYDCGCGRHHGTGVKYLKIGRGIIEKIPEALETLGVSHPYVVCDANTYKAAGERGDPEARRDPLLPLCIRRLPSRAPF